MPRPYPLQSNFSAGEWSPKLDGQVTLEKYHNACSVLENFTIEQQGGITRRPGTKFIAEAAGQARLIPFIFSVTTTYMLELSASKIRFYKNRARIESGGVPVEVTTTYTADELRDIDVRQSADVLYFFHTSHPVAKLERYSDTIWRFRTVTWTPPPSFEYGARPVFSVTPSATTGSITLTAAGDSFFTSDTGRDVLITSGTNAGARVTITAFTSSVLVSGTVTQNFVNTSANAAGTWKITDSPKSIITAAVTTPVGLETQLTLSSAGWRGVTGLADSDCGRFVILNGGTFEISEIQSVTQAKAFIRSLATTAAAQPGVWTLQESIWSAANGYAETASFHEDRLYVGAREWLAGSKSGDYENHAAGVNDDDAVLFAINSDELPTIKWLAGRRRLLIGANGAEFTAVGSTDAPISPSNIQVGGETAFGSNGVAPVRGGDAILFVSRAGTKLREFTPDPNSVEGNFVAPDLLILAEHLTNRDKTIVELAYRREPIPTVWAIRSDGVLLGCTYLRDQNVVGWHRHPTQGTWESVATMPSGSSGDETWLVAKRTVGGTDHYYVEVMDDTGLYYEHLSTDCTYTCDSATTVTTFGNLTALNGLTVSIVADGAVYPDQVVTGSAISVDPPAKKIEVGLSYTPTMTTMRPEIPTGAGSIQAMKKRWTEVLVRLLNCGEGVTVTANGGNAQVIETRSADDSVNVPVPLFSGDKRIQPLGWDDDAKVTIAQTKPLPCSVLMLSGIVDVGS